MQKRVLKPIKNSVVCKKINDTYGVECISNVFLKKNDVPMFEILDYAVDDKADFPFECGDIVMSTSTGDEIEINDGETLYLFKTEHIMCKVQEECK